MISDLRLGFFACSPVSGRDFVLTQEFDVSWSAGDRQRRMCLLAGFRFGPGIKSMPGLWRGLVNPFHLLRASCAHDALYASEGGIRPLYTDMSIMPRLETVRGHDRSRISLDFRPLVDREEADALSRAIAIADGINKAQAAVIHRVLRLLGQSTWNE